MLRMTTPAGLVVQLDGEHAEMMIDRLMSTAEPLKPKMPGSATSGDLEMPEAPTGNASGHGGNGHGISLRRPYTRRVSSDSKFHDAMARLEREDDKAFLTALVRNGNDWIFVRDVWKQTPPPAGSSNAPVAAGKLVRRVQAALKAVGFSLLKLEVHKWLPYDGGKSKSTGYRLSEAGRTWLSSSKSA